MPLNKKTIKSRSYSQGINDVKQSTGIFCLFLCFDKKSVFRKQNRLCICLKSGNIMLFEKKKLFYLKKQNTYSVSCVFFPVIYT